MNTLNSFYGLGLKITNLHQDGNQWFWHLTGENIDFATIQDFIRITEDDVFFTDSNGEGIFVQRDADGEVTQLVGTCQFSACQTSSGMRRALYRMFNGN